MASPRPPIVARALALRAAILAAGWWILTAGDPRGLGFGIAVVGVATATSLWLGPPAAQPWRPLGLARLALHFLVHSLRAGVDVARLACSPRRLAPELVTYRGRLPPGPARDVLAGMLSLMPGSLTVDRTDDALVIHVLATPRAHHAELAALEDRIIDAMGPAELRRRGDRDPRAGEGGDG